MDICDPETDTSIRALIVSGEATDKQCAEAWEKIVRDNARRNNSLEFDQYERNYQQLVRLLRDNNEIRGRLFLVLFEIDDENIAALQSKGYKIDLSTNTAKVESVTAGLARSRNYASKIEAQVKKMAPKEGGGQSEKPSFEEYITTLSTALGFQVSDTLTLAMYSEYRKVVNKKNKQAQAKKR